MKNPTFLIICTGYNCEKFAESCMNSIRAQTYKNYEISIVDDGSTDKTFGRLNDSVFGAAVRRIKQNVGTYYARDFAIEQAYQRGKDYDIIVMLDMDDGLLPDALEKVAKLYNETGCWMTYGNWLDMRGKKCPVEINYSDAVHSERSFRKDTFRCTHLRTFRRELYERIPKWELTRGEINSYPDAEILFSMMEMCGKEKIGVVQEPIYIYNNSNPISTLNRFGKDVAGYNEICNRPKRELIQDIF